MNADTLSGIRSTPMRSGAIAAVLAGVALLAVLFAGGSLQANASHASASATLAGADVARTQENRPILSTAANFDVTTRVLPDELLPTY